MYNSIVPPFSRSLSALSKILTKAEQHCEAHKIDPAVLFAGRLFPDMLPFSRQVQLSCDFAARAAARLSGSDVPNFPDVETSFQELQTRIATALSYLDGFTAEQFADAPARSIELKLRSGDMTLSGLEYLTTYSTPQFYFHVTTAYNILRHNGVPLGKRDYMGA